MAPTSNRLVSGARHFDRFSTSARQRAVATLLSIALALGLAACSGGDGAATGPAPAASASAPISTPAAPPVTSTPALVPAVSPVDAGALAPVPASDGGVVGVLPTPSPTTPVVANDAFMTSRLQAANAPGAAMAIVKHGTIAWTKGYGFADLQAGRAATPDTLFMLASISKTFVATALLQLMEHSPGGLALLDADVSGSLGVVLRNPRYPNIPITYRMLLTHTSSLIDGAYFQDFSWQLGDSPVPLATFLSQYLADINNWSTSPPGTEYSYSNAGSTLTGYIVERVSGRNLQAFSQQFIFAPLGMTESSWFLTGLDATHIAMPYVRSGNLFQATGQYGFPDYPDGQLRTSAQQLARFLIMLAGDGSLGGARILQPSTIAEMRRPQFGVGQPYQGLILFAVTSNGATHLGHNGATLGGSTDMWFDPTTGAGYILLTSSDAYLHGTDAEQNALADINNELARMAAAIP